MGDRPLVPRQRGTLRQPRRRRLPQRCRIRLRPQPRGGDSAQPVVLERDPADGSVIVRYRRRLVLASVSYRIARTSDLAAWERVPAAEYEWLGAAPAPGEPDAEIVTLRLPAGAAAAQAFRIEADLP
ncbi:MAG: hypothetical protein R3F11_11865 [Verrucomicrobiales bacterium]